MTEKVTSREAIASKNTGLTVKRTLNKTEEYIKVKKSGTVITNQSLHYLAYLDSGISDIPSRTAGRW